MSASSRIGHHRGKYQQWLERNPHANLHKPLADLDWWITDAQASLARMQGENGDADIRASLVDHIADLADARAFLHSIDSTVKK